MPNKKDLIAEHEKLVPILREGSKEIREAEANDQAKELKEMKKEEITFAKNGQWSLDRVEKSGYGPKGADLYDVTANQKRKANNTNDQVIDAGKNVNVKNYTSAKQGTAKVQASAIAAKQKELNIKQPVKTEIPVDLKAKLEAQANKVK